MAEYHQVEYRIGKDGKITETVINASGSGCTATTAGIEQVLGEIASQELLPEYYEGEQNQVVENTKSITQK